MDRDAKLTRVVAMVGLGILIGVFPLAGQECSGLDPESGYPIAVTLEASEAEEGILAASVARVAAYRWRVPSRRRNAHRGWEQVRERILPPEPRWADDWEPEERHRAVMRFVLFRGGDTRLLEVESSSGDDRFDESLETILEEPMPGGPDWPELAASDSVVVIMRFGDPRAAGALVRFAAEQTPVELNRNSMWVQPRRQLPRSASATVKYDVLAGGLVEPRSIEVLRSDSPDLTDAIVDALRMARFQPATSNCRPISQSVVQTFGN